MFEIHISSVIIGLIIGYFIGGFIMLTFSMKSWSQGYDKGSDAAKEIWWDFKRREREELENKIKN